MQCEMPWPAVVLGLLAFLSSQASSAPGEAPFPDYDLQLLDRHQPSQIDDHTYEVKRALTLLSRLSPIRNVFRPPPQDIAGLTYDPVLRTRYESLLKGGLQVRRPGPLRYG